MTDGSRLPAGSTLGFHCLAARGEDGIADADRNLALRDIDIDDIAFLDQCDGATFGGFRRNVTDRQSRGAAGEAPIGDERAGLAEALRFDVAGRIEHLLHAGAAFWPLIADEDDITRDDLAKENAFDRRILAFEDPGRAGEGQDRLV